MPELLAHTNMDSQAMSKLRDHIEDFVKFLAKDPNRWIASPYESGLCTYLTLYSITTS
jgi:mortality factor 4-like protein 1